MQICQWLLDPYQESVKSLSKLKKSGSTSVELLEYNVVPRMKFKQDTLNTLKYSLSFINILWYTIVVAIDQLFIINKLKF